MCASRLRKLVRDSLTVFARSSPLINGEKNGKKTRSCVCVHVLERPDQLDFLCFQGHSSHPSSLYGVPSASALPHQHAVRPPTSCTTVGSSGLPNHRLGHDSSFLRCISVFSGSGAGGCLPFYSNSGCRGPDRQEGPTHQTTCPFRRSVYQGEVVLLDEHTDVRLVTPYRSKLARR